MPRRSARKASRRRGNWPSASSRGSGRCRRRRSSRRRRISPMRGGPPFARGARPRLTVDCCRAIIPIFRSLRPGRPRSRSPAMHALTLYDKLWDSHVVRAEADGTALLYIDRHLVHEVTSPQAYEGLTLAGRKPWRIGSIVATADHNTPTKDWDQGIRDPVSRLQVETLDANIRAHGAKAYFPFRDASAGHRARDRSRAGRDAPGNDRRLRRLAHQHARRVRGARVRHRDLRGRARARDAVPADEEGEVDAGPGRRRVAGRA